MSLMNQTKRTAKRTLFLRFSIPYLILLFIPLFMGLITYNKSISLIGKEIEATNMAMLEQSKNMLDARMSEITQISREIKENPKIVHLQQMRNVMDGPSVYHVVETSASLYHYNLSNNFILDYFVVLKNNGVVLNERTSYRLDDFYSYYQFGQLSDQQWRDMYLNRFYSNAYLPSTTMVTEGKEHSVIPVIQTLGQQSNIQGAIIILLDSSKVQSLLNDFHLVEGGSAYIIDENGSVMTSVSRTEGFTVPAGLNLSGSKGTFEMNLQGQDMIVAYNKSQQFKWTQVVVQPVQLVKGKMYSYKRWTQILMIVSLLIGAVVAIIMAYRNSRPVRKLIQIIGERWGVELPQMKDAYGIIQAGLTKLIDSNEALHQTNAGLVVRMQDQASFLRFSLFERLLRGQFHSQANLDALLVHSEVHMTGAVFSVVIFDIHHYRHGSSIRPEVMKELDIKKIAVKEMVQHAYTKQAHLHENEDQQIIFIASGDTNGHELKRELEELLNRIQHRLADEFRIKTAIAVGEVAESLMDLPRSYEQARQALTGQIWEMENQVLWYDRLPKDIVSYFYPSDIEVKLINYARSGDKEEILHMMHELYRINFEQKQLPFHLIQMLIYDMWGTVLKLLEQVNVTVTEHIQLLGKEVRSEEDALHHYHVLYQVYEDICDEVNKKKKSNNERLIIGIRQFVDEEFTNTQLSLTLISEKFMLSEVYLSQFFKEQLGINFSDYLEGKRMAYACSQLLATNRTINQISLEAGYNSANSFFKAFKRVIGMSPTEYRKHAPQS